LFGPALVCWELSWAVVGAGGLLWRWLVCAFSAVRPWAVVGVGARAGLSSAGFPPFRAAAVAQFGGPPTCGLVGPGEWVRC